MKKLLITNLCYGDYPYRDFFLEHHLKTMLDPKNIPAHKDRISYAVFTDKETLPFIREHRNLQKLGDFIDVSLIPFKWPSHIGNHFDARYNIQLTVFMKAIDLALERDSFLSFLAADSVVAKEFLERIFKRIDDGYDAVFANPIRGCGETMTRDITNFLGAMPAKDLFALAYKNLHPLWVASHWNAPQFTRLPYTILWGSPLGLVGRSFSVSPITFQPREEMKKTMHMVDMEIPSMCENPFWATDWTDCPIAGAEPLLCFYPPFRNWKLDVKRIKEWTKGGIHKSQYPHLEKKFFYPDEETAGPLFRMESKEGPSDETFSDLLVKMILSPSDPMEMPCEADETTEETKIPLDQVEISSPS